MFYLQNIQKLPDFQNFDLFLSKSLIIPIKFSFRLNKILFPNLCLKCLFLKVYVITNSYQFSTKTELPFRTVGNVTVQRMKKKKTNAIESFSLRRTHNMIKIFFKHATSVTIAADLFPYGIQTETVCEFRSHFVLEKRFGESKPSIFWLQQRQWYYDSFDQKTLQTKTHSPD